MVLGTVQLDDGVTRKLVAHRGDQELYIENTLAAFQQAYEAGAIYAECDIQFTQDFVPVVIHDDSLDRLCGESQCVSELTLENLKVVCRPFFELLPLSTLLVWLEDKPELNIFVEIKPDVRSRLSDMGIAELLVKTIPKPLSSQVIWISESSQILQACAKLWSRKLGWVAEGEDKPSKLFEQRLDYAFMPFDEMELIHAWQSKGVNVGVYTVNDAKVAAHMLDAGVNLVETNLFSQISSAMAAQDD